MTTYVILTISLTDNPYSFMDSFYDRIFGKNPTAVRSHMILLITGKACSFLVKKILLLVVGASEERIVNGKF